MVRGQVVAANNEFIMNIEEALNYINEFTWSKSRPGLSRIRALLNALRNPHEELKFVHVAGSNGKGSVCAMVEAVLRAAGYKTGLHTSPYLEDFKESFRYLGEPIEDIELCRLTERVRNEADRVEDHPTQFEIKTAIAMLYFQMKKCDIVVLETGLGGELDSTNVIDPPEASVITKIGYEHTEYLGDTLEEIASAKAGIIKAGSPVIAYENVPEVMAVFKETARSKGCEFYAAAKDEVIPIERDAFGQSFLWQGLKLRINLLGNHQLENAAVALKTLEILKKKGYNIPGEAVLEGLSTVSWPARFEILGRAPLFILDGGHNEQCAAMLAENLKTYFPDKKFVFIVGVLSDKDYSAMIDDVLDMADSFICITPDSPRALCGRELKELIESKGFAAEYEEDIAKAVQRAVSSNKDVVSFGSLYAAGEVRKAYRDIRGQER